MLAFIIVFGSLIIGSVIGYFEAGDSYGEMSKIIAFSHEHHIQSNMSLTASDTSGLNISSITP